ncbi:hypothetical protein ACFVHB_09860 [Kitasatospora sp. NPDC127111]|uniref:hypothetical protein n=1 Tax=Kitasatospora sp. NPDC127111 TaxID=3345363 RepID=UPI00362B4CA5
MTRAERLAVLARQDEDKVFAVRRATPVVAALRVSRSTLYGLLAELRTPGTKDVIS